MTAAEMIREEYNRYHREWRAKNKERVKEYNKRYWQRRAAKKREEAQHEQTAAD